MSQREGWNMCRIICWALAAVAGILVVKGIIGAVGFIAAVMAGAALAVFIGLVLTRLFCMKQGAGADMVPSAEAAKASAASTSARSGSIGAFRLAVSLFAADLAADFWAGFWAMGAIVLRCERP